MLSEKHAPTLNPKIEHVKKQRATESPWWIKRRLNLLQNRILQINEGRNPGRSTKRTLWSHTRTNRGQTPGLEKRAGEKNQRNIVNSMELMDTPPKSVMNFALTCFPNSKKKSYPNMMIPPLGTTMIIIPWKEIEKQKAQTFPVSLSGKNKHDNGKTPILCWFSLRDQGIWSPSRLRYHQSPEPDCRQRCNPGVCRAWD